LRSKDGIELIDESITSLLKDNKLSEFSPRNLFLSITYGSRNSFTMGLNTYSSEGGMHYEIECSSSEKAKDILYEINNWIEKNEPNKAMKVWNEYSSGFTFFSSIIIFITLLLAFTWDVDYKQSYKNDINQLIEKGITNQDQSKAMELLLKYISEYRPLSAKPYRGFNKTFIEIICLFTLTLLVSIYKPKTIVGIGKKKSKLNFYIWYSKIVLVTIPTIFILTPLIDWIKEIL
jgi:hypothetical protein